MYNKKNELNKFAKYLYKYIYAIQIRYLSIAEQ